MAISAHLAEELKRVVEGDVLFDRGSLALYSTDASIYRHVPIGVVRPRHEGDALHAVALARENGIPVLPRGGGTSLAGQSCNAALILDCSRYMTAIRSVDAEQQTVVVEPGVIQSHLNAAVLPHRLFFPPDPATKDRCTLGGMIGNNSCGAHSALYGKTVDNVIGLDLLLYDGTRLELSPKTPGESEASSPPAAAPANCTTRRAPWGSATPLWCAPAIPAFPAASRDTTWTSCCPRMDFNLAGAVVGSEGTLAWCWEPR